MQCARTKVDFRAIPALLDVDGNCKRCGAAFDDHPEVPEGKYIPIYNSYW